LHINLLALGFYTQQTCWRSSPKLLHDAHFTDITVNKNLLTLLVSGGEELHPPGQYAGEADQHDKPAQGLITRAQIAQTKHKHKFTLNRFLEGRSYIYRANALEKLTNMISLLESWFPDAHLTADKTTDIQDKKARERQLCFKQNFNL
jgi:hypothetical protein